MKKALLVVIITLLFSLVAGVYVAKAESKPFVPEFTLKFVDHSYDVPPTYSIDQYTGKNVTTQAGYHVENKSIEVTIKSQRFISYNDGNGNVIRLYYSIRVKGHFVDWMYEPSSDTYLLPSDYEFTVIAYGLGGNNGSDYCSHRLEEISDGGQVDFQVEAIVGYYTRVYNTPSPADQFSHGEPGYNDIFTTGEASGWSNTQTITINTSTSSPTPSSSPSPSPTQQPTLEPSPTAYDMQAENYTPTIIMFSLVVGAVVIGLLAYAAKHKGWK